MLSALPIFSLFLPFIRILHVAQKLYPFPLRRWSALWKLILFFLFSMHCIYRFYVYFGSSFQARFICILSSMCLCCSSHTNIRSIRAPLAIAKAIQATWMWDETKNLFGLNEYKCLVDLVTVKWNIRPRAVDLDLFHVLSTHTHIHTKKERYIFRVVHSFVCCRFFFLFILHLFYLFRA